MAAPSKPRSPPPRRPPPAPASGASPSAARRAAPSRSASSSGGASACAAGWLVQRAATPPRLLLGVVVGGGLLSALFVNDTICLVVTPVLLAALGPLRVRPTPYLIGLAMGANVGSVVAVTGNPQNMLVGIWSGASFGGFLLHMLPVGLGGLAITYGYLRWAYRAELP